MLYSEDILDGNINITLGLIWSLILKFHVGKEKPKTIDADAAKAMQQQPSFTAQSKQELLEWVKNKTKRFEKFTGNITNFTTSFQNGIVLCSIVDCMLPGAIEVRRLNTDKEIHPQCWVDNNEMAINFAFLHLKIPAIINGVDVANKPDELSMVTYLTYFMKKDQETAKTN